MSFGSAFGGSLLGGITSNLTSLNRATFRSGWGNAIDPLGGAIGWASLGEDDYQDERSLDMASALSALNYNQSIRGLKEGPSAYKEGLLRAGYNPMLAISNGVQYPSTSVPPQSPKDSVRSSPIDIAATDAAFASARQIRTTTKIAEKQSDADLVLKSANAKAALDNAETNKWQLYDASAMGQAGFEVVGFGASAKGHIIQSIRVNKVTGETYDALTGQRIKVIKNVPANTAKEAAPKDSSPVYHYHDHRTFFQKMNDAVKDNKHLSAGW